MRPPPATGLATIGLSDSALHAFAADLQGVVADGVSAEVPSPAPSGPTGKVATLCLLHLQFACGVAVDRELPPIWEAVARRKGRIEGIATLNQALMKGLTSCRLVFGGRTHLSASFLLLAFKKNVSLLNPYLNPTCTGGRFTPWLTRQGLVEASTHGSADASFLAQQLDGRLALADSFRMAARVRLAIIPSADEALYNLGKLAFVALHLFSVGGRHSSAVAGLLRLIERLEEIHNEVQGMI